MYFILWIFNALILSHRKEKESGLFIVIAASFLNAIFVRIA